MRRRVAIALLIVSVVGAAVFWLSQPKRGTVEWHKREFRDAYNRSIGNTPANRIKATANRLLGGQPVTFFEQSQKQAKAAKEAQSHLAALVGLGFLAERRFVLTNRPINEVLSATLPTRRQLASNQPPWLAWAVRETTAASNELIVTGLPEVMLQYDELIRQADVPESGK